MKKRFAVETGSYRGEVGIKYYGPFKTEASAKVALSRNGWVKSFASQATDATEEEWKDPAPVTGDRSYLKVVCLDDLPRRIKIMPSHLLPRRV